MPLSRNTFTSFVLALLLFCSPALAALKLSSLAIIDVSVIPMDTERVLDHQTVLIRDGKVLAIGPPESVTIPAGTQRIEGRGKFLMPGLIDAHVHLMSPDDLISYLAYGVTTVVNMSGTPADLKLRAEVRNGSRLGPDIYTAGPTIDGYPPLNEVFITAMTPTQGDALVVDLKHQGYDFIKVYGTLRPDVFHAIAAACLREHFTLAGHINRQIPAAEVFRAGQALAAHAEDLLLAHFDHPPSPTELAKFADEVASSGITVTANVAINPATAAQVQNLDGVLSSGEAQYLSAATYSRWIRANNRNLDEDPKQHLENLRNTQTMDLQFIRLLHDRKVPIILGTDASAYGFPGQSAWEEIHQTETAGLNPFAALATATRNSGAYLAKYIDHTNNVGTVTEGATADLLLLNSNPLTSNLSRDALAGVVLRGRWVSASQIDAQRSQLKQRLAREHAAVDVIDQLLEAGNTAAARERISTTSPATSLLDEWVLLTKARKHEEHLPVAIDLAKLYVAEFPDRFSSHQLLADLLQKSGQNSLARAEAQRALDRQPQTATAADILERATFSDLRPSFSANDYRLQLQSQDSTVVLHLQKKGDAWTGSLKMEEDSLPLTAVYAGADQLWFTAGKNWQEKEFRLTISPNSNVAGSWWSMFGRNGTVNGSKIDEVR